MTMSLSVYPTRIVNPIAHSLAKLLSLENEYSQVSRDQCRFRYPKRENDL